VITDHSLLDDSWLLSWSSDGLLVYFILSGNEELDSTVRMCPLPVGIVTEQQRSNTECVASHFAQQTINHKDEKISPEWFHIVMSHPAENSC